MKIIQLTEQLTDEELQEWGGHFVDMDGINPCGRSECKACLGKNRKENKVLFSLRESCKVFKPNGEILLVYRKNAIPRNYCAAAHKVLLTVDVEGAGDNRGLAAGIIADFEDERVNIGHGTPGEISGRGARYHTYKKDGTKSRTTYAAAVDSAVIGYMDYYPRIPYCRATAWNLEHPEEWAKIVPYFQKLNEIFKDEVPHRWQLQRDYADTVHSDFMIEGTVFTTITVNRSWRTALHTDKGDFEQGFGVMSALEAGQFTGGELIFPKYKVAVDMRTGGVALADVHEWHGNAEIKGIPGRFIRFSMVSYLRRKMANCGSCEEELAKAKIIGTAISESHTKQILGIEEDRPVKLREVAPKPVILNWQDFGRELFRTEDLDPIYVMLVKASLEPSLLKRWLLAYFCFYDAGTASRIAEKGSFWENCNLAYEEKWPRGSERRHYRGQQCLDSLTSLQRLGEPEDIIDGFNYCRTLADVTQITKEWLGFGNWIDWKMADIMERVMGIPIDLSMATLQIYAEPAAGAAMLLNRNPKYIGLYEMRKVLNMMAEEFKTQMAPPRYDRLANIAEFETILCKFKSHSKGRYPVGFDSKHIRESLSNSGNTLAKDLLSYVPSIA